MRRPLPDGGLKFGPEARLRKSAEYRRVYDSGRRIGGRHFLCFFRQVESGAPSRMGVTVTRRVGKAVQRNRLRRVVKEFFRLRSREIEAGFEIVVNARESANDTATRDLWSDLEKVLKRAGAIPE